MPAAPADPGGAPTVSGLDADRREGAGRYDFKAAEPRWQAEWDARGCFDVPDVPPADRPKYYVLEMFPYPSGQLHMGHVRNYTLGDVVARYKRARGHAVLHPMGWDAFGLPAENAARERGVDPAEWTLANIETMRATFKRLGLSLNWDREFATCLPEYYGQQQKLFLDFLAAGLVERRDALVNWDPVDQTVLANEQVVDGRGWRSGAVVETRRLSQWFLRITAFAPELLAALDGLDQWPERVRVMQAHWIGRSEGARVRFPLTDARAAAGGRGGRWRCTPRARTRCSGCRSWRWRRSIRWRRMSRRATRRRRRSWRNAAASAPARRRSRVRRSGDTTPACAWRTRSCRGSAFRCGSPTSC